ncbi:ABC transporter permease [Ferrovibrio sp.]|uniref:ABC transporter permease n=1 Tax=Ferrovibrio sp. TaxID=1917215 RepID=UPI00311E6616
MKRRRDAVLALGLLCGAAGALLPLGAAGSLAQHAMPLVFWLVMVIAMAWLFLRPVAVTAAAGVALAGCLAGAVALHDLVQAGARNFDAAGLWLGLIGLGLLVWRLLDRASLAAQQLPGAAGGIVAPLLFGLWLLYLWEMVVTGFAVPAVLLPPPSAIGHAIATSLPTLGVDFVQTFIRAVIPGFVIGSSAGFLVGVLVDRVPFLQRGLLPVGNMVSALPIIGIAPIMVMWFGFDWQSKAAVVVVMTFFPMLVNTIAGLNALGRMERDLMATYAASYGQTLLTARLPAAMPFLFTALKVNSTLALIGAIVAEFFGTPIIGMGFRISTEVGRMNIPMVWASIAVAALAGSASYGLLTLAERWLTFWHPSFRKTAS